MGQLIHARTRTSNMSVGDENGVRHCTLALLLDFCFQLFSVFFLPTISLWGCTGSFLCWLVYFGLIISIIIVSESEKFPGQKYMLANTGKK